MIKSLPVPKKEAFSDYSHQFSPKKVTRPQLFACLALKEFEKKDYRGVCQLLADCSDLSDAIGLRNVPHFTTLQKAGPRLLKLDRVRRLIADTVARVLRRAKTVPYAAVDSSGFDAHHAPPMRSCPPSHRSARRRTSTSSTTSWPSCRVRSRWLTWWRHSSCARVSGFDIRPWKLPLPWPSESPRSRNGPARDNLPGMSSPHLTVVADKQAVAHAALRLFVTAARKAIETRDSFSVALAGGGTPAAMYELLAAGEPTRPTVWSFDWAKVHVYFGDERCVPPEHPDSNFRMASETLLSKVPIPPENIHRMRGELEPHEAAKEYGQLLKARVGDGGLDLVLLGMGDDGHTASLFPHSDALAETHHRCVAHFVEKSTTGPSWRITLTAPFINRAAEVLMLVEGEKKAARLAEVIEGPRDPQRLPIQMIQPAGQLVWVIDEAAALGLKVTR